MSGKKSNALGRYYLGVKNKDIKINGDQQGFFSTGQGDFLWGAHCGPHRPDRGEASNKRPRETCRQSRAGTLEGGARCPSFVTQRKGQGGGLEGARGLADPGNRPFAP